MRHPIFAAALAACAASAASAEPLRFAVFGDIQEPTAEGHAKDLAMAERINAAAPAFTVFIGDIQGGDPCVDQQREEAAEVFARLQAPLVFTPGDNAWTDCRLAGKGGFDPFERLARLREDLVPEGRSLGQNPMPLVQQEGEFRENARWTAAETVFVTLHMPGSNNGLFPVRDAFEEFERRNAANLAWLRAAYDEVRATDAKALVVLFHANPGWDEPAWRPSGYNEFKALLAESADLGVPVLAVHGDSHVFTIDKPLVVPGQRGRADHLTRVEVFGPPERGFVIVTLDPANPELFAFTAVELEGYGPR